MHACNFLSKHFICSNARKTQTKNKTEGMGIELETQPTSKEQLLHFSSVLRVLVAGTVPFLRSPPPVDILIQIFNKIKAAQVVIP